MKGGDEAAARRSRRLKIFEPAVLVLDGGDVRAHILDISHAGACVHSSTTVVSNQRIALRIDDRLLPARVRWVDQARFGVIFDLPLSDRLIDRLLAPGSAPLVTQS